MTQITNLVKDLEFVVSFGLLFGQYYLGQVSFAVLQFIVSDSSLACVLLPISVTMNFTFLAQFVNN